MDENRLIELQKEAAMALDAGAKMAARVSARKMGVTAPEGPTAVAMGGLIANPAAFWGMAATLESGGNGDTVEPIALGVRYASAKLASGDFDFARQALLGQSQWLGVLAVNLARRADAESVPDRAVSFLKLALAAQRQAATTIATAAALNKLDGADAVSVSES